MNTEFQESAIRLADILDLDEIQCARLLLQSQGCIESLDCPIFSSAIVSFHQRRQFLLECFRLTVSYSVDGGLEDDTQSLSRAFLALVVEARDGSAPGGSAYVHKCLQATFDIERWLQELGDRAQGLQALGQRLSQADNDVLGFQQQSLTQQHESLSAIVSLLIKASYSSVENFYSFLDHLAKLERWNVLTVHYAPMILAFISQHGSPEGSGSLPEARALHNKLLDVKDSSAWKLRHLQATKQAWWFSEYSGW